MKVHILFEFKSGATGGGNQFLKALKNFFKEKNLYTDSIEDADLVLFNSYQYINELVQIKQAYPDKIFIHRVDGPIRLYNSMKDRRDYVANVSNAIIADGTVFQSEWSKRRNKDLGMRSNSFEATILNAPDETIFNRSVSKNKNSEKTRIIATSWSSNWKKGFGCYKWLDENLDFQKVDMTFVGNSPIEFQNIKIVKPLASPELAGMLREHDIFLTASKNDPCSNSLIEALHCGLPAIVLNSGGHPEIVGNNGLMFEEPAEIPELIEKIQRNYSEYSSNLHMPTINEIGSEYLDFLSVIYKKTQEKYYQVKKLTISGKAKIHLALLIMRISEIIAYYKKRIGL